MFPTNSFILRNASALSNITGYVVKEVLAVGEAMHRGRSSSAAHQRIGHIIDPEIDMNRRAMRRPTIVTRMLELVRWLTPGEKSIVPPMRSVGRELEEFWPSHER
ncbi:MAG TPA: hypothetical protein VNF45_09105 [Candidatus Binataceae bacterium]|nr:hypothetical protein [Candidatus Binataceae bacterium]